MEQIDIKKLVTIDELESVIRLCRKRGESLNLLLERRAEFIEDTKKIKDLRTVDVFGSEEKADLLINTILKEADKHVFGSLKDDFIDFNNVVEFVNKFSETKDYLKKIEFDKL